MEIHYEYRKEVKNWLLRNTNMTTEETERFVSNANKTKTKCPKCGCADDVYSASIKSVNVSGGSRLFMGLLTYGLSEVMGSSGNYYLCFNCSNFWS